MLLFLVLAMVMFSAQGLAVGWVQGAAQSTRQAKLPANALARRVPVLGKTSAVPMRARSMKMVDGGQISIDTIELTLQSDNSPPIDSWGLTLTPPLGRVVHVASGSAAERAGVRVSDVIVAIDGQHVSSIAAIKYHLDDPASTNKLLCIMRPTTKMPSVSGLPSESPLDGMPVGTDSGGVFGPGITMIVAAPMLLARFRQWEHGTRDGEMLRMSERIWNKHHMRKVNEGSETAISGDISGEAETKASLNPISVRSSVQMTMRHEAGKSVQAGNEPTADGFLSSQSTGNNRSHGYCDEPLGCELDEDDLIAQGERLVTLRGVATSWVSAIAILGFYVATH